MFPLSATRLLSSIGAVMRLLTAAGCVLCDSSGRQTAAAARANAERRRTDFMGNLGSLDRNAYRFAALPPETGRERAKKFLKLKCAPNGIPDRSRGQSPKSGATLDVHCAKG